MEKYQIRFSKLKNQLKRILINNCFVDDFNRHEDYQFVFFEIKSMIYENIFHLAELVEVCKWFEIEAEYHREANFDDLITDIVHKILRSVDEIKQS